MSELAASMLGISPVTVIKIVVDGKLLTHFDHFELNQDATTHHNFKLRLAHDALGAVQDHSLADAQKMLGKRITITFTYKNIPGAPTRDFVGIITKVGLDRAIRNLGRILISGQSPTILLDGAPNNQSFGGDKAISLNSVAEEMMKQAFGTDSPYAFAIDSAYDSVSYCAQYEETHYNFLARTAESFGEQFFYDGTTLHFGKLSKAIPLVFGRDVEEIEIAMKVQHVNPSYYGYNSSNDELLTTNPSEINHFSTLGKEAYDIALGVFKTPAVRMAPIKARSHKDIEATQKSAAGSRAVEVFTTSGKTAYPFLYPGCVVAIEMVKPGTKTTSYFTNLVIIAVQHRLDALGNYVGHFEAVGADTGFMPRPKYKEPVAEPQIAKVLSNSDPKNQGRVQVKFDWQYRNMQTEWIRVMTPDAGGSDKVSKNRGFMAIPEVGDQVMIGFQHHHPDRPFVMGGMFTGKVGGGGGNGNNIKSLSSKSGHTIELNDGGGITVRDKAGNAIIVDGSGNITASSSATNSTTVGKGGEAKMKMDSGGNISIEGTTKIEFKVGGSVITLTSDTIALNATNNTITGTNNIISGKNHIKGGDTKIDGGNVFIN